MPDTAPEAIPPPKSELPTKFAVLVIRYDAKGQPSHIIATVRIREDGHITGECEKEELGHAWRALSQAAGSTGAELVKPALLAAAGETTEADVTQSPTTAP